MTHPSVFQRVANATASPAVFLDARGLPAAWNIPAERLGLVVRFEAAARPGGLHGDVYALLVRRLLTEGLCLECEVLVLHDGRAIRLLAQGSPIQDADGRRLGAVIVFTRCPHGAATPLEAASDAAGF